MPPRKPPPTETARVLRRLRKNAGLSAVTAGELAGLNQSAISHFETGRTVPSKAQILALCRVYDAGEDDHDWLLAHAREADSKHRRVATYRHGAARLQREYGILERESTRIVTFHPTVVPGLLQTDGYMRAIAGSELSGDALEDWLATRRERQTILDEPGRTFTQIVTAGALLWALGGPKVMADQLAALDAHSRRPNLELGIVPPAATADFYVQNGFDLYERPGQPARVIVGTHTSVSILGSAEDTTDTDIYLALLGRLSRLAVWGDEARAELGRLADWYRGL
jgi:transcriptional regulator with XRE-family HTH domain